MWFYSQLRYTFQHFKKALFKKNQVECGFEQKANLRTKFFKKFYREEKKRSLKKEKFQVPRLTFLDPGFVQLFQFVVPFLAVLPN